MYQTFIFSILVILVYTARPEQPPELLQESHYLPLILALTIMLKTGTVGQLESE